MRSGEKVKVLVIDDDLLVLKTIEFTLERAGYSVTVASDGQSGIDKVQEVNPDIIITDLMMPQQNGLAVVNHVKSELKLTIPVIVLSAVGLETTVLESFKLGADDFVTKPFSPNELVIRVEKLLKTVVA